VLLGQARISSKLLLTHTDAGVVAGCGVAMVTREVLALE
jgi:hypothetical protein